MSAVVTATPRAEETRAAPIVDVRTDETDRVRAKTNVQDTLVKYPDIAGLVGLWSYNGPAIAGAVKQANAQGKVKIICFDEEEETLAGVKDGTIYATTLYPFTLLRIPLVP